MDSRRLRMVGGGSHQVLGLPQGSSPSCCRSRGWCASRTCTSYPGRKAGPEISYNGLGTLRATRAVEKCGQVVGTRANLDSRRLAGPGSGPAPCSTGGSRFRATVYMNSYGSIMRRRGRWADRSSSQGRGGCWTRCAISCARSTTARGPRTSTWAGSGTTSSTRGSAIPRILGRRRWSSFDTGGESLASLK
jgi:hypothetical protein